MAIRKEVFIRAGRLDKVWEYWIDLGIQYVLNKGFGAKLTGTMLCIYKTSRSDMCTCTNYVCSPTTMMMGHTSIKISTTTSNKTVNLLL